MGRNKGSVNMDKCYTWRTKINKYLEYVGEYGPVNVRYEYPEIGRKYYEHKRAGIGSDVKSLLATYSDWPFPEAYYKYIGSTVRGFAVFLSKLIWFTKKFNPTITKFNKSNSNRNRRW